MKEVLIEIRRGMTHVVTVPAGVRLVVRDFDLENEDPTHFPQDAEGRPYSESDHGGVEDEGNDGLSRRNANTMRRLAREQYARDGEIEVDEGARLSVGDGPGCYVQAWVWVEYPDSMIAGDDDDE